jgi:hypothetical protein
MQSRNKSSSPSPGAVIRSNALNLASSRRVRLRFAQVRGQDARQAGCMNMHPRSAPAMRAHAHKAHSHAAYRAIRLPGLGAPYGSRRRTPRTPASGRREPPAGWPARSARIPVPPPSARTHRPVPADAAAAFRPADEHLLDPCCRAVGIKGQVPEAEEIPQRLPSLYRQEQAGAVIGEQRRVGDLEPRPGKREGLRSPPARPATPSASPAPARLIVNWSFRHTSLTVS